MAWGPHAYDKRKYVITNCSYIFQGYQFLMKQIGVSTLRIMSNHDDATIQEINNIESSRRSRVSVFLDGDICSVLTALKRTASLINKMNKQKRVIIYSHLPACWLFSMLSALVADKCKLEFIQLAGLSNSCQDIVQGGFPLLTELARAENKITNYSFKGLTPRELDVVLSFYRGVSPKEQSEMFNLALKTIYNHRNTGLLKLQFIHPWIKDLATIRRDGGVLQLRYGNDSFNEMIFQHAIKRNEIFPVYELVTDKHKNGKGFEIFLRWKRQGEILKLNDFLKELHNTQIWLQLTAFSINAAVRGVNTYKGKFYFAINIPPALASGNALPRMAQKAVEMLSHPDWAEKIVFEFAETIDVNKDKTIPETLKKIRQTGCRLFLDSCFSSEQVMFPLRKVAFDGLKLDHDIVDNFLANDSDYKLIKAMQYYSELTEGTCIAEGVDSAEKFEKLAAIGINNFQGCYLSRAVVEQELDYIVRLFS